jgi:hypothetical protein
MSISIDTSALLGQINSWITTFWPIAVLGIAIPAALAVIGYLRNAIVSGFSGAKK